MSATIRDVARLAGVSPSTVSRVLNKTAPISEETCNRIYRAMEELRYVPNDIARSFASGSSKAIAIAINVSDARSYSNSFFNNTVFGIETTAHNNGYNLIITGANDERGGVSALEKLIMSKKIDGLILPVSMVRPSVVRLVEDIGFPCVVLGRMKSDDKLSWVDIANAQAGANAVRYLLKKGYRKIAFLSRGDRELFTLDRLEGYRSELTAAGITPDPAYVIRSASSPEDTARGISALLQSEAAPDAVICGDDRMALAALRAGRQLGLRIPEDLGVLCFDNTEVTEVAEPGISAVDVDTFELGRTAAENLLRQIERPGNGVNYAQLTTKVIERSSTAR